MKINNKGVTIVELLVSLALLSVVLMFLYNLLSNVTFEKNTDFIANSNQANRIWLNTLQINIKPILGKMKNQTTENILVLKGTKTYKIMITENTLAYYVNNSIQNTWKIKGGKLGKINCENSKGGTNTVNNAIECKGDKGSLNITCPSNAITALDSIKITECTIPVYTENIDNSKENNNTLDDITFSFIK